MANQNCDLLEYIIIDGASTDETKTITQYHSTIIDKFISEPDDGIYHAMNKALQFAKGSYVYFLNAGDTFFSEDTLMNVAGYLRDSKIDIIYGDTAVVDHENKQLLYRAHRGVNAYKLLIRTINHQAIFASRKVFDLVGGFNTKYRIRSDYDWLLRCYFTKNIKFEYIPMAISRYLSDGQSMNNPLVKKEAKEIRSSYLKNKFLYKLISKFRINQYLDDRFKFLFIKNIENNISFKPK